MRREQRGYRTSVAGRRYFAAELIPFPSGGVARWPKLTVRHSTKWRKGALSRAVLPHHLTSFDAHGQPRDRRDSQSPQT
jgi:hypothetical protein